MLPSRCFLALSCTRACAFVLSAKALNQRAMISATTWAIPSLDYVLAPARERREELKWFSRLSYDERSQGLARHHLFVSAHGLRYLALSGSSLPHLGQKFPTPASAG